MTYETTPTKINARGITKTLAIKASETLSTPRLIWILVKRHKVAILATGNVLLVLNWAIPEWHTIIKSLI